MDSFLNWLTQTCASAGWIKWHWIWGQSTSKIWQQEESQHLHTFTAGVSIIIWISLISRHLLQFLFTAGMENAWTLTHSKFICCIIGAAVKLFYGNILWCWNSCILTKWLRINMSTWNDRNRASHYNMWVEVGRLMDVIIHLIRKHEWLSLYYMLWI